MSCNKNSDEELNKKKDAVKQFDTAKKEDALKSDLSPALESLLGGLVDETAGLAAGVIGDVQGLIGGLTESMLGTSLDSVLGGVAVLLTCVSQMQAALFEYLCMQLRKELLFRKFLYEKTIFYLKARKEILLRYNAVTMNSNLKKVIAAQKYVDDALKAFKGVEDGLKPDTEIFKTVIFDRGMDNIDSAVNVLTGNSPARYEKRKLGRKKSPMEVLKSFETSINDRIDAAAQAVAMKVIQLLIDLKNNVWYIYKIITTLLMDITILKAGVDSAINTFNSSISLAEASQNIRSFSITGRSTKKAALIKVDAPKFQKEPKDWDSLEYAGSQMSALRKVKAYSASRGLLPVNSSIRTWITTLGGFGAWTEDTKFLTKQLLEKIVPLIENTSNVNDAMTAAIKAKPSSLALAGKTIMWVGTLSTLKMYSMLASLGKEQESITEQLDAMKRAIAWFEAYDKDYDTLDISQKTFNIIAKGIGNKGDTITTTSALGIITEAVAMSFVDRDSLKEALVSTNEAISQCEAAIGENAKILQVIAELDTDNNSMVGLLGALIDAMANAGPPLSDFADFINQGGLDAIGDTLSLAASGVGMVTALAATKPCKEEEKAADKRADKAAKKATGV